MDDLCDIVIGAASGMGAAVAARLATGERSLLLADLDEEALEAVAAELPGDVRVQRCDITSAADVRALGEAVGEVGTAVVTAGLSPTMADGGTIMAVNAVGTARVLDELGGRVGPGSVAVVLASMAGHMLPDDPELSEALDRPLADDFIDGLRAAGIDVDEPGLAYVYSKLAVIRLVRRSAAAWGERGARVLSVSPGIIDTPMGRQENESQPIMAQMASDSALGRMITADEVAAVVEFLISPTAVAITGTDVLVDGGVVARMI